jgi:hypothetical protein
MQEEIKAVTEEVVSALQKFINLTDCLSFTYNEFKNPCFEVQLNHEEFYRWAVGPITYVYKGKSIIRDTDSYEARFYVGDAVFIAVFFEDELPESIRAKAKIA